MRRICSLLHLVMILLSLGCASAPASEPSGKVVIAFGACAHQDRPQPIWDAVVAAEPDLFIFAGDNIYGDTQDMDLFQAKYDKLADKPGYQRLLETCPVLAVYDDHDYGVNDGGKEYPKKQESAKLCLDFFGVPADDPRRSRPGIYGSTMLDYAGQRVQIILLDTRYFRDPLDRGTLNAQERKAQKVVGLYQPTDDTSRKMLGQSQWDWLEDELNEQADVRLIVSSIQVVPWEKGMECWATCRTSETGFSSLSKKPAQMA